MKTIGIILLIIIVFFLGSIPLCLTIMPDPCGPILGIYIMFAQIIQIIITGYCGNKFYKWFLSQIKDND